MVLQDTDRKRTIWKIKLQKNPITTVEETIKKIEKEYNIPYSSKFFSRAVFYYLRKNKISSHQSFIFSKYLIEDSQRKIGVAEMRRGNVYYFPYNPINKKVKYYDWTPCIIYLGMSREKGGYFYGLNLNYLNPFLRYDFFSRLPYVYNENMFKQISKTQQKITNEVGKKQPIQFAKVDTLFGYEEAKNMFKVEYKHLIKRYSIGHMLRKPTLIPFRIAKIVTALDMHNFNTKNPFPIWKNVFDSIQKERSI